MTDAVLIVGVAVLALVAGLVLGWRRRGAPAATTSGRRVLVPFTGTELSSRVLDAAIRVSRAENATLVPAYLMVVPLRLPLDAPMVDEISHALPLLEAVEHAALRSGVPVDARIEKGRTATHALQRVWESERFDRVIAPAPKNGRGFDIKDLAWILTHSPVETLVLRPAPEPVQPPARRLRHTLSLQR